MEPLSPRVRMLYLLLFIALFFMMIPFVIFYADGWRYKSGHGFVRTGGIYVGVPYADASVSINGEVVGTSGFLARSFYVGDLAPSSYVLNVEREGYLPWSRVVVVEEQLVTDASALLIPKRIIPERLIVTGVATTGVAVISRSEYDSLLTGFATSTPEEAVTAKVATSTPQDESGGEGLFVEDGGLFVRWTSEDAFPPSHFCETPSRCRDEIALDHGGEYVQTARYFRGGIVYATREGGIYFAEADVRPSPIDVKLFDAPMADVRVIDDTLIIKSGQNLYRMNL